MTPQEVLKRSINDISPPQAKKFKNNDYGLHSPHLKMMMLGGLGCQQELLAGLGLELGGDKNINHNQHLLKLPVTLTTPYYSSSAFSAHGSRSSFSSSSPHQRYAWTPPSHPNDVRSIGVIAASSDNHDIFVGGFSDDYILEKSIQLICPGPSTHVLPASRPTDNITSLEMLSGVSCEVAEVTKTYTSEDRHDATRPGWLPTLALSSSTSTPSQPTAMAVVNDRIDPSYTGERHPSTNQRHGFGIMTYPNGSVYTGNFENDKRHGFGKCWYPGGLGVYTGFWANGKRNGLGKMVYSNGEIYHGEWLNDLPYQRKNVEHRTVHGSSDSLRSDRVQYGIT